MIMGNHHRGNIGASCDEQKENRGSRTVARYAYRPGDGIRNRITDRDFTWIENRRVGRWWWWGVLFDDILTARDSESLGAPSLQQIR